MMREYCHTVMPIYTLPNSNNTGRFFYAGNTYNQYPVQNEVHQVNSETLWDNVTDNSGMHNFEDSMQFSTKTVNDDAVLHKIIANYPGMQDLMPEIVLAGISYSEAEQKQMLSMIQRLKPTMSKLFELLHDTKLWKWVTQTWSDKKDLTSVATNMWKYNNLQQVRNIDGTIESIIPEFAKILIFENIEMSRKSKDWVAEEHHSQINQLLKKRLSYVEKSIMHLFLRTTYENVKWIKIDDVDDELAPIFTEYEQKIKDVLLYILSALRKIYFPYDSTRFADEIDQDNLKFIEFKLYRKTSAQKAQMNMFEGKIMHCVQHYAWLLSSEVVYQSPDEKRPADKTFRESTVKILSAILTQLEEILTTARKYYIAQIKSQPTISPKCHTAKSEAIIRDYVGAWENTMEFAFDVSS